MTNFFKLILTGIITIFLIIVLHYVGWLKPTEGLVIKIFTPVQQRLYDTSLNIRNFHSNWLAKRDLLKENEELQKSLEQERVKGSIFNSLQEENDLLKKELKFVQEQKIKTLAAKIVTGVSDSLSQSVIINRGERDGVEKDMAVIAGEGVLIGKVCEVYADSSKVLLLTDNKSKVASTIQNSTQTAGLVEGQFGLSFSMTNITQDQEIKEGDLIVTSGLEGKIPKNLLIARVDGVSQVESEIFKTALLNPIISFDNLSYVLVVTP